MIDIKKLNKFFLEDKYTQEIKCIVSNAVNEVLVGSTGARTTISYYLILKDLGLIKKEPTAKSETTE